MEDNRNMDISLEDLKREEEIEYHKKMDIFLEDLKQKAEEERVFQRKAKQVEKWKIEIETYIQNLSDENADKLIKLFDKNSTIQEFGQFDEIYHLNIWVKTFAQEREAGIKNTIFTGKSSIQELMTMWRKAYFLLWRVEFESDENAKEQFLLFLEEENISILVLQVLLYMKAAFLERTGVWLVQEFKKIGNHTYAETILRFLKQYSSKVIMER